MGDLKNGRVNNLIGWATCAFVTVAVAVMLGSQLFGLLGIDRFGRGA